MSDDPKKEEEEKMTAEKKETIHSLNITLQRSQDLELTLRFRRDDENAKTFEKKNKKLSKRIDKLIKEAMQDWLADAQEVTKQIKMPTRICRERLPV